MQDGTMTDAQPPVKRSGTQTLERGLDVIECIVEEPMNVRDLARSVGLGLSTTRRLAMSLNNRGFLAAGRDGRFRAGPKLIELGIRGQNHLEFVDVARDHLKKLSASTGMPSFLGERDGDYSVHLHRAPGTQRLTVSTPVGTRRRLPETSLGKALLLDDSEAEWDRLLGNGLTGERADRWKEEMREARRRGAVIHDSAPPDRIRAIGAPVRDASGRIVAAVSIVTPAQYADDAQVQELVPLVIETAQAISRDLGLQ
jgi:DNA-binding IclR family transcriptional regulator